MSAVIKMISTVSDATKPTGDSHKVDAFHLSAAVQNSKKAEMENKRQRNRVDCADLDKQNRRTILQRTQSRPGDMSSRQGVRSDCIVIIHFSVEFLHPAPSLSFGVLTHCQTCVLNSLSWPLRLVDPLGILGFGGRCSDGFLFDTSLEESEVVLKGEQKHLLQIWTMNEKKQITLTLIINRPSSNWTYQ